MNFRLRQMTTDLTSLRQFSRHILAGGAVLTGLLLLTVLMGVPRLFDGTRQGQAIASQIARATGLRVLIEGPVEVSLWPRPRIVINRFSLVTPDGGSKPLAAPRVDLNVSLFSLLANRYRLDQITLVRPELTLRKNTDGTIGGLPPAESLQALPLRRISIRQGRLTLLGGPQPEVASELEGYILLPDATTVLQMQLNAQWRGAPARLLLDVATPLENDPSLARLEIDVGAAETSLKISGTVDFSRPGWPGAGQIDLTAGQGAALWALAASLDLMPSAPADAALRQPLSFSAFLKGDRSAYDFEAIRMRLGEWTAEGLARFVAGTDGGLSVAVKTAPLDLAAWPSVLDWGRTGALLIPSAWLGAFDLNFASAGLGAYHAENVRLKGEVRNGALTFSEASASLPGDTRVRITGAVTTKAAAPARLEGRVELESLRLRDWLAAWQVALPSGLDEGVLRQVRLTSEVRGDWNRLGWSGLDLQLDGIHLTGQISPPGTDSPFAANLNVEQLDLDRYAAGDVALPRWLWELPPVGLSLRFARLRAGGKAAENVALQAALADGLLTVKSLDAADFGGNRLRLSGTLGRDAAQDADLTLRLISPDFAGLRADFPPAARLVPAPLADLLAGQTDLSVRWRSQGGEAQQLSSASTGDGRFDVVVTTRSDAPVTWKARVQSRETALWLARIAPDVLVRPGVVLGPSDLYAEGVAVENGRWQVRAIQGQLAGTALRSGELTVTPAAAAAPLRLEGRLALGQASIDLWDQTLNPATLSGHLDADLSLTVDKLLWRGSSLEQVQAGLQVGPGGQVALRQATGHWHEGTFTASGQIGSGPSPTFKGELELRETALALMGGDRFGVEGVLDFSGRFEGSGHDWAEVRRTLAGEGEFSLDSGTLRGIDFAALTEALLDRRTGAGIEGLLARGGTSPLSSLGGDFVMEQGVARAVQVRLRTPAASADISAELDLSGPRLDASAAIQLREVSGAPSLTLRLSGPLHDLRPVFDTTGLLSGPPTAPKETPEASAGAGAAADEVDIKPPEPPTPPVPDQTAGAAPDPEEEDKKDASPSPVRERPARNRPAAAPKAAVAAPAGRTQDTTGSQLPAPPSIQELLEAMPALSEAASSAVRDATPRPPAAAPSVPSAPMPNINFTPVDEAPAPRAAPARAPVATGGLAPEFAGEKPRAAPAAPDPAPSSGRDVVEEEPDSATPPPASVNELMGRVAGEE